MKSVNRFSHFSKINEIDHYSEYIIRQQTDRQTGKNKKKLILQKTGIEVIRTISDALKTLELFNCAYL